MVDLKNLYAVPEFDHAPQRVVSLVPSLTESLFTLGFGGSVAAVTDYCTQPAPQLAAVPRIGGTKMPDIDAIVDLKPELVFANQEENSAEAIQALVEANIPVWLSFPKTVEQAIDVLRALMAIYHNDSAALQIATLQKSVDWARASVEDLEPVRYFCPIWQGTKDGEVWWMTFNQHTYPHDVLATFGGENIFAERERRYPLDAELGKIEPEDPGGRDTRYPRVTIDEVADAAPDLILLPNEPFNFDEEAKQNILNLLSWTPAVKHGRVKFVDGSLLTWHGVRIGRALQELPDYFLS